MENRFVRCPLRELPDGRITRLFPFHFSLEGASSRILCREDQDYDVFVKILAVCALRKGVIIVIYIVVSNHVHAVILAESQDDADAYGEEVKRMYAMYFSRKYSDNSALRGLDSKPVYIDSDRYLRNAVGYVIRNAADNRSSSLSTYKWSGYRMAFCGGLPLSVQNMSEEELKEKGFRYVSTLNKREKRCIMHTGDDLKGVNWLLNPAGELEPVSLCDWKYLEAAFDCNQAFFMRTIGNVNVPEMDQKLVVNPRTFQADGDFLLSVNEVSERWFKTEVHNLSLTQKIRLISYVRHCFKTSPRQLARAFELSLTKIQEILRKI